MKKFFSIISLLICCCLVFTACKSKNATDLSSGAPDTSITTADTKNMDFSIDEDDTDTSYDGSSATKISLSDTGTTTVSGSGVKTDSSNGLISGCADITITAAGTYLLSGEKSDVMVIVNAENKEVHIVLSGVTIKNSKGPAIYVKSAKKVTITLQDGTTNTISDGSSYSVSDSNSTLDAAIFSKADLTINGNGTLTLKGNYKHGIVSKDDLIITSGTFNITSKKVGISGKDCVKISGGNITVNAGSDGIRSDNTDDASKGYIYISGGTINITAGNDGIQAETVLKIENANLTVKSGGGSSDSLTSSSESYKGLKAGSDIYISGGSINIDSKDDSIHSNGTITISEGKFSLSSGDDGRQTSRLHRISRKPSAYRRCSPLGG